MIHMEVWFVKYNGLSCNYFAGLNFPEALFSERQSSEGLRLTWTTWSSKLRESLFLKKDDKFRIKYVKKKL